jgi:hypothetical protein
MSKRGTRPTRAELSAQVRAKWSAHVAAWQREGGRQADYARRHGLAPGLFSLWKCRLAKLEASAGGEAPSLIPVTITREPSPTPVPAPAPTMPPMSTTLQVRLPNGVSVQIEVASPSALPAVLAELATLRC